MNPQQAFKYIAYSSIIAIVTAVVLRILLPVPVLTFGAALLFVFMLQVIDTYFGRGLSIAKQMGSIVLRTVLAGIIFLALRFLVGQWLRLYPTDTYDAMGPAGGFWGIFWGRAAADYIIWEFLFALVAGGLVIAWTRGKARKTIATIFVFSLVILTLQMMFPTWASIWPSRDDLDRHLYNNGRGVTGRIGDGFALPASQAATLPTSARSAQAAQIEVEVHPDRWSEKVVPPPGVYCHFDGPPGATVRFEDGTEGPISQDYGIREVALKGFRFKGPAGQKVTVRITPR